MNYLAHFYLSFGQEPLIVGNLLGDFVRGRLDHERNAIYNDGIKKGIDLHRKIDSFTDTHPIVKACHEAMPATFGHIKAVVSDMYFDYFLAKSKLLLSECRPTEYDFEKGYRAPAKHFFLVFSK